ncbi:MAG: peptidase M28, partial [Bacteroidota bacterium]
MRHLLGFGTLFWSILLSAQAPSSLESFAETITVEDLQQHLHILAADDMEGRETGQPGLFKAARYLEEQVRAMGIPGVGPEATYSQPISFISERWSRIELSVNEEAKRHLWDYYAYPSKNADRKRVDISEVTFLGYGIESDRYNDYAGQD